MTFDASDKKKKTAKGKGKSLTATKSGTRNVMAGPTSGKGLVKSTKSAGKGTGAFH